MAIATLTGLSYWYPNQELPALKGVHLSLEGGLTVVSGPSGGGKSTLLRLLNGLVPHFHGGRIAGSVVVAGANVIDTPTRRLARHVGFVFQDPELQNVYDSVEREVAFGLENLAVPRAEMPDRVEEALAAACALHLAGRSIRTLSGGERQRVALASALASRPDLVVLDEPTSQLDPAGAEAVLRAVHGVVESGRAVVIAEHRLERLRPRSDVVVEVADGEVRVMARADWAPALSPEPRPRLGPPGEIAWSLSGVTACFGDRVVVEDVSVEGRAGEVVALSGPNGGGKTTLLRVIAGLLEPSAGRAGRAPGRVAYLPQNPSALLHRPTVRSEVALTLRRSGESEPPDAILRALGLAGAAERYPRDLSCGERQRAALAAVLPGDPRLCLLDEPTRGMDDSAREALIRLLVRLRNSGAAIVLATHDASLRDAVADRIVHVAAGRVTAHVPEGHAA